MTTHPNCDGANGPRRCVMCQAAHDLLERRKVEFEEMLEAAVGAVEGPGPAFNAMQCVKAESPELASIYAYFGDIMEDADVVADRFARAGRIYPVLLVRYLRDGRKPAGEMGYESHLFDAECPNCSARSVVVERSIPGAMRYPNSNAELCRSARESLALAVAKEHDSLIAGLRCNGERIL